MITLIVQMWKWRPCAIFTHASSSINFAVLNKLLGIYDPLPHFLTNKVEEEQQYSPLCVEGKNFRIRKPYPSPGDL